MGKNIFFTHKLWHKLGGAYNVTPICYAAILMNMLNKSAVISNNKHPKSLKFHQCIVLLIPYNLQKIQLFWFGGSYEISWNVFLTQDLASC